MRLGCLDMDMRGRCASNAVDMTSDGRRLVAILVADVVGYSPVMDLGRADTPSRVFALQSQLLKPAVSAGGGRIVKTARQIRSGALGCAVAFAFYLWADRVWERDVQLPALLTSDL